MITWIRNLLTKEEKPIEEEPTVVSSPKNIVMIYEMRDTDGTIIWNKSDFINGFDLNSKEIWIERKIAYSTYMYKKYDPDYAKMRVEVWIAGHELRGNDFLRNL